MIIIGEYEKESNTISVRKKSKGDIGKMDINNFLNRLKDELIK